MIIDQLIENCEEPEMRSRMLLKDYNLAKLVDIARQVEFEREKKKKEKGTGGTGYFDEIRRSKPEKGNYERNNRMETRKCFNCGKTGHLATFTGCPAQGKKCNKCQRLGHFENTCRKREGGTGNQYPQYPKRTRLTTACVKEEDTGYTEQKRSEQYLFYTGTR